MPAYDIVFKSLSDLQIYAVRLGRFLSDQGMGHNANNVVRTFLVLTETLRALVTLPRDNPIYAFMVDAAAVTRSELLCDLAIPAPALRAKLGEGHTYFKVVQEAIDVIDNAVRLYPPNPAPHPSTPPPLNNTHKRRSAKGGR